ncbi:MAG: CDP-diacylglycerol--serine O-phosphatidyltransferase [Gallionellaceae bacterium]|jgi:CDP-diacylglycerol--serine O-phosphatidyltransferase|nr:CDP-diacylglycerol--serine O-phosphatidyltransferase [Gallionellaceae bacterium]
MSDQQNRKPMDLRRRGIYILPNLFTTGALFAGFFAIVQAMNMRYELAAIAIFAAIVLDGLDGRVARMTHTQSEFGAEYDSLSDMVSFGVAPALVVYEWTLKGLGKWGWFAAFIYCVGTALRLARFNTNIEVVDKSHFQGLPSPAAAALVSSFVLVMRDNHYSGDVVSVAAAVLTVFAGFSMVSNFRFFSFKSLNRRMVPFIAVFLFALFFILVSVDPPIILFLLFFGYSLSGYVTYLWGRYGKRDETVAAEPPQEVESPSPAENEDVYR